MTRYRQEQEEWQAIAREMAAAHERGERRDAPTAYEVSREQKRRMWTRGARPMTYDEIVAEALIADALESARERGTLPGQHEGKPS